MKRIEIGVVDPRVEQAELLAWAVRADAGEALPEAVARLNFASYQLMYESLTLQRMELLRHIGRHEGLDVQQLGSEIHGNPQSLQEDVEGLCELGLLEQREGKLYAPFDEMVMHYPLREAA